MATPTVSESIARELVTRMFGDDVPSRFDDVMYVGPAAGRIVAAVHEVCEERSAAAVPSGLVVDREAARAERVAARYDEVDARPGDYLHEEYTLDGPFDYVACVPPERDWVALSPERRRAVANNFGQVTVADDDVDATDLYVSRAIRDLSLGGRGAFLTTTDVLNANATATVWRDHYYRIEEMSTVDPAEYPTVDRRHVLTTVTNDDAEWGVPDRAYESAVHERALDTSIADSEAPFTAAAVATPDVTGYEADESVADAYVDMMLSDFDAAPVYEARSDGRAAIGYVSRGTLRTVRGSTLRDQVRQFTDSVVVAPSTGLDVVIGKLADSRFLFVRRDGAVDGILTRFDLNSLPVYAHLFDCFSQFEIGLRRLVRAAAPDWHDRTDETVHYKGKRTVVRDRLMCAELGTLLRIVSDLGLESALPDGDEVDLHDLRQLRNDVAHYVPIVHTMSERATFDDTERGAPQLAVEYEYLQSCIDSLACVDRS